MFDADYQKKTSNRRRTKGSWWIALIDPVLTVPISLRKRIRQSEVGFLKKATIGHFVIWLFIWTSALVINDSAKPNPQEWLNYRVVVISGIIALSAIAYLGRSKPTILLTSLFALGAWQSLSYSWSMRLGVPVPGKWVVYLPAVVLMTASRSFIANALALSTIVAASSPLWRPYNPIAWMYTDAEIAMVFFLFAHIVWKISIDVRVNEYTNEANRAEIEIQKAAFQRQLLTFVSPSFVTQIERETRKLGNTIAAFDQVLQRRKATVAVLYSDLRGFTKRSVDTDFVEKELIPSSAMIIDACESNGGVAKQIGDAVFVYYALPDPEESILRAFSDACRCAIEEGRRINGLGRSKPERYFILTFGEALVGNMASHHHREPTIIGAPANLAARIDELTKNKQLKDSLEKHPTIVLSEASGQVIQTFSDDLTLETFPLETEDLIIRSFETERELRLFKLNDKNMNSLNMLLEANNMPPVVSAAAEIAKSPRKAI